MPQAFGHSRVIAPAIGDPMTPGFAIIKYSFCGISVLGYV
jgi:hypothetical protein